MTSTPMEQEAQSRCGRCRAVISTTEEYRFRDQILCENCCIAVRTPRKRKTHWQYLGSIKSGYLIPGKK